MNEQLQAALAEIITKVSNGADSAVAFLSGQLPDVVQQLLMWKLVANCAEGVIALLVLAGAAKFFMAFKKGYDLGCETEKGNFFHDGSSFSPITTHAMIIALFIGGAVFISSFVFVESLFHVTQICFAPKVYLIEYVTQLTTAGK